MAEKKYEVTILSVNPEEGFVSIKFGGGKEGEFEVISPAKIEYAKVGKAEVSLKGDKITYLRSKEGFGGQKKEYSKEYPQKSESYSQNSVNDEVKQRLIVRQHTQKVSCELVNSFLGRNPEITLNWEEFVSKVLETSHTLEEDIFRNELE